MNVYYIQDRKTKRRKDAKKDQVKSDLVNAAFSIWDVCFLKRFFFLFNGVRPWEKKNIYNSYWKEPFFLVI